MNREMVGWLIFICWIFFLHLGYILSIYLTNDFFFSSTVNSPVSLGGLLTTFLYSKSGEGLS